MKPGINIGWTEYHVMSLLTSINPTITKPEAEYKRRALRVKTDVTIETAFRRLLKKGLIRKVNKPYSCYDAHEFERGASL